MGTLTAQREEKGEGTPPLRQWKELWPLGSSEWPAGSDIPLALEVLLLWRGLTCALRPRKPGPVFLCHP